MAILVLLPSFMSERFTNALRKQLPDMTVCNSRDAAQAEIVEVIVAWALPPGILASYPNLKLVCAATAGVDKLLTPELPAHVQVTRVVDPKQQIGIGHYILAAALRHTRSLALYAKQQQQGIWKRHLGRDPLSFRIGVLGLGGVGSTAARMFNAIGFEVLGWSRSQKQIPGVEAHTGDPGLEYVLKRSNILVSALPLTDDTRCLLNRATLSLLPVGAYFINVGRGEHVVEADLIDLINSGHISGATLDVFCNEPPAANEPVWTHPHIEATPHVATDPSIELAAVQCGENVRRLQAGQTLLNAVDRDMGY